MQQCLMSTAVTYRTDRLHHTYSLTVPRAEAAEAQILSLQHLHPRIHREILEVVTFEWGMGS